MFMATLDNLVMTNALPVLHTQLHASVEELQWFVNAYTLMFASLILFAVAIGDRFGRRTVFAVGIAIFTLASAAAAFATDPTQLIARSRGTGSGRRGHHAALALAARRLGRAAPAPARDRHLGRDRRASASRSAR